MFDPKNLATEGLYPGLVSTFSIAVLGALEIEVIIEPVVPGFGGGGGFDVVLPRKDKYKLRIIVRRKGKTWNYETIITDTTARVIAKIAKVKKKEASVVVESVQAKIDREEPTIKVTKK